MKNCLRMLFIVVGISLALTNVFGQLTTHGAVKFDEFGYMNHENYSARLDNIAIALQNEPASQGYFIFYNGRKSLPGAGLRYMKRLQNYMTNTRGIEASRLIVLEGGRREEIAIEFWISSSGNPAPVPAPPFGAGTAITKSYLYDIYSFDCDQLFRPKVSTVDIDDCSYGGMDYEDQSARLDGFAKVLSQTPGASARLMVNFLSRDSRRKIQRFIQKEREYLLSKSGVSASTIAIVYRRGHKYRSVHLWFIAPVATGKASQQTD